MKLLSLINVLIALILGSTLSAKEIAGINEVVTLLPENIQLNAKLDTGADSSSIDAQNIEYFTKNGEEWVSFILPRTLDKQSHQLEYPLAGTTKIISRVPAESSKKGRPYHRRPVINMEVCIGDQKRTIKVNLFDRSNFTYPFLLGASGLEEFHFLVDVEEIDLLPNKCVANEITSGYFEYDHLIILFLMVLIVAITVVAYRKLIKRKERV